MSKAPPGAAGPATHYELFAGLRDAGVGFLVTGAAALTLHGVPRLTPEIDLLVDPDPANIERLGRRLAAWGYGQPAPPEAAPPDVAVRRFAHPQSALGAIGIVRTSAEAFARLRGGAAVATLVDVGIPVIGRADLQALKEGSGTAPDREDAAALKVLASIHPGETGGEAGSAADTRREQIRKFSRWSVAARLDWLLAAARLSRGMSPESKPMTRGLVRRRGWYGR